MAAGRLDIHGGDEASGPLPAAPGPVWPGPRHATPHAARTPALAVLIAPASLKEILPLYLISSVIWPQIIENKAYRKQGVYSRY
jgi:hypothetical protein